MHPVFAQALRPFAPPSSSVHRSPTKTVPFGGAEFVVEYDYHPAERPVYDLDSPLCGPGYPAEVNVISVRVVGSDADLFDLLSGRVIDQLAETILLEIEE